jgi:putative sigma-54 modulation protein
MKVKISSVHFKTDQKLESFIKEKVGKLSAIYEGVLGSEVTLKVDNSEKLINKIAEIHVSVRGKDIFAKKQSRTFEEATDIAVEALRKQLTKHKEKMKGI